MRELGPVPTAAGLGDLRSRQEGVRPQGLEGRGLSRPRGAQRRCRFTWGGFGGEGGHQPLWLVGKLKGCLFDILGQGGSAGPRSLSNSAGRTESSWPRKVPPGTGQQVILRESRP